VTSNVPVPPTIDETGRVNKELVKADTA